MQLNSLTYILFLFFVYGCYLVTSYRFQNLLLLVASFVFYAWWDLRFLLLVILSTVVNYGCGLMISKGSVGPQQRLFFSLWVLWAGFLTVFVQWKNLVPFNDVSNLVDFWHAAFTGSTGITLLFILTIAAVLSANLFYPLVEKIAQEKKRGLFVFVGVAANLLILGFFKYYNFFAENIEVLLAGFNLSATSLHLDIVLPIGVSFYTFKGLSYVVDAYRGQNTTPHSFIDFSVYMAFFPAILAGPIDRANTFFQQLCQKRKPNWQQTIRGIHLFLYGLFKKVVIADGLVRSVASVFDSTGQASWIDVVAATLLFTIQIYCDFSGYTDMARGTAKFFGIDLMVNFRLPYFSKSPREFWNRWHISLSTWLRDYLYIPLGGNRKGRAKTYRNLIVTMVLGGLWHGAAWNFVLWGLYHGVALGIHRALKGIRFGVQQSTAHLSTIGKTAACFLVVSYGWLLFRAPSLGKLWELTSTLVLDFGNMDLGIMRPRLAAVIGLPILCIAEFVEKVGTEGSFYEKMPMPAWAAFYAAIIFSLAVGLTNESTQFIYMVF